MNTSFMRNTKQKVGVEAGKISIDPVKRPTQSTSMIIKGLSVPGQQSNSALDLIERIRQRCGKTMGSDLNKQVEGQDKKGTKKHSKRAETN
ncbi:unnamed protein product [Eruca vesicaria subsp. sativa]|uniref:Uncharacterized protein n=1 Tax=Eruca vesicaria subsp. sativa TaxID=29727 RepID=A0ABC8K579_ERUVS|nr:unnamed protein product [Eruca vesicaria subsp. sativa]